MADLQRRDTEQAKAASETVPLAVDKVMERPYVTAR